MEIYQQRQKADHKSQPGKKKLQTNCSFDIGLTKKLMIELNRLEREKNLIFDKKPN